MKYKLLLITLLVCGMGWGQTTVTYSFSSQGAVAGLNEPTPGIALDSNVGFGSFKNSGTANPVINTGQLRLYQNATKGGSIIIYASNGVTITDLVVYASGTTGPAAFTVDGSGAINLAAGTTYTMSGLSATTEVEFYQKDGSSSNRIYVDSFDVTYTLSPPSTTTYTTSWSNGDPTSTVDAIIDGNFSTSGNLICKDLTVNAGATLTINAADKLSVMGDLVNNGSIVFKSDATGSGMFDEFTGTISGVVQVERYIPAKRAFRFLSPSVTTTSSIYENWQENGVNVSGLGTHITGTGGATNGFDATATNNPSMFGFDHATGQWAAVNNTNTNTLTAGTPYRLMVRGDRTLVLNTNTPTATPTTLRATGVLHIGNFTPTLNQTAEGYSFIGNPYQAPIDMKEVLASSSTNMNTDVLYYWDPTINVRGGYVTRTLSDNSNDVTSDFTEILQPGQAVFVKKDNTANPATMTISETNKSVADGAAGVFRNNATQSNTIGVLRANLQANINNQWQTTDAALALFNDSYSWNVSQEDASKMTNLDEEVSFMQENTSLAIAKQNNASETDELPIRLQQLRHTNYRWVFDLTNYNGYTPYLFDTEQNTLSVIENGTVLPFTTGSNTSNRFKIVFQNTTLSSPTFDNQISLYPNPSNGANGFYMTNITANAKVTLFNLLGQSVPVSTSLNGTTLQVKPMHHVAKGIYVVQVIAEDGATKQVKWIVE